MNYQLRLRVGKQTFDVGRFDEIVFGAARNRHSHIRKLAQTFHDKASEKTCPPASARGLPAMGGRAPHGYVPRAPRRYFRPSLTSPPGGFAPTSSGVLLPCSFFPISPPPNGVFCLIHSSPSAECPFFFGRDASGTPFSPNKRRRRRKINSKDIESGRWLKPTRKNHQRVKHQRRYQNARDARK